jgi:hypothetical protein
MRALALLAIVVTAGIQSCQNPTDPIPDDPPRGKADSTILENIALVRSLEAASGRDSILVALGGYASPIAGTPCPGASWWYRFAARPNYQLYEWSVYCDGAILFQGQKSDALHHVMAEIGPVLNLDSDDLIRIAGENGGHEFLNRFPEARVGLLGRFIGRRPIWEMEFFTAGSIGFSAAIDGETGEVLRTCPPCS